MPKRRGRGDGTLTEIKRGVWRLRVYAGTDPVSRRPLQASRNFHGNRTAALKALRELSAEVGSGQHKATKRTTVAFLLEEWQKGLDDRRPATRESYARIVSRHLIPFLGHIELRKLNAYDIDTYYRAKRNAGMAPRSILVHHAVLSAALSRAVAWGWLPLNPAKSAVPPERPTAKLAIPAVHDVRSLITAASDDPDLAAVVGLAAVTGARRGELAGLQWSDVDWDTGTLVVQRQRVPLKGGDVTGPLKHGDSRRVTVGELGLELLRRYRALSEERAARLGVQPGQWLLSVDGGVTPWPAHSLGQAVTELGKRAGVPITTHAFRRFAATEMVGAGVDIVTTAGRLGHTPDVLLDRYAGARVAADVAAAGMLEAKVLGPD